MDFDFWVGPNQERKLVRLGHQAAFQFDISVSQLIPVENLTDFIVIILKSDSKTSVPQFEHNDRSIRQAYTPADSYYILIKLN